VPGRPDVIAPPFAPFSVRAVLELAPDFQGRVPVVTGTRKIR
jgi:hypothetical protein